MFDIVRRIPLRWRSLHHHVILIAFALVAGHLPATHHGLDSAGNILNWHTHIGCTFTVDVHADLWFIQAQICIHAHDSRVLCNFFLEGAHHLCKVLVAVSGDDHEIQRTVTERLTQ